MIKPILTADRLRELVNYDPETGVFTRKVRTSNRIKIGDPMGTLCSDGYLRARIDNTLYLMHRLAWLYVHGEWPGESLDHKNGVGDDNRIANLREADHGENAQNVVAHKDNVSGYLGVNWERQANGWRARIKIGKKVRHLGMFPSPELAHQAYLEAKRRLHAFNPIPRDKLDA